MPVSALRALRAASLSDSTGNLCVGLSHAIPSATQKAAQAPSRSMLPCKRLMAAQGRGSAPAPCPEARRRCRQLHTSKNNHDFGVSQLSAGVTHCRFCTQCPRNQDSCHSLFLILCCCPFLARCAAAQAGRCTALVCYLYAGLASVQYS